MKASLKTIKGNQTAQPSKPEPTRPKTHTLNVKRRPGQSSDRALAELITDGVASNASTAIAFMDATHPDLSLNEMVNSLRDAGRMVNANDFTQQEQMLNAQATALNAIFAELCRRAALNMGQHLEATETYMRLALKAQSQCRTTIEALSAIKNPPIVYAKQANFANGPQQVNNGVIGVPKGEPLEAPAAHEENGSPPIELLEGEQHGGTVLDAGATAAPARGNPTLEAVGAVNRAAKRGREGTG